MSMLDKPLPVIFPELNSLQIGWIRELMKREYERGLIEGVTNFANYTQSFTIGNMAKDYVENYTPNVEEDK